MNIDISKIPFSRAGSFMVFSFFENSLWLRDVHGGDESPSELFRLTFENEVRLVCTETKLTVQEKAKPEAVAEFIFPAANTLQIRTSHLAFKMDAEKIRYDTFNQMSENIYEYISYKKEYKYQLQLLKGELTVQAPWKTVGNEAISLKLATHSELHLTSYRTVLDSAEEILDFAEAHRLVEDEYQAWLKQIPDASQRYQSSRELASYLLWTNTVAKDGLLTETITYMSKNWMQNIWSWDNCFNAILLAENFHELAFNQLKVFIDYQDKSGAYPDFINDKYVSYNCVKPPIHAWAYQKMMELNPYFEQLEKLELVYDSFSRNTQFWLKYRCHNGLPYYTHGNDSGWDNASIFHEGFPVTAPDLSAYLIRQMDILASMAKQLGKEDEAKVWLAQANYSFDKFLPSFYDGEQLNAFHTFTGKKIQAKSSAILFLPIVLAYRFEEETNTQLINQLLTRFECEYGIATEEPTSPHFSGHGYWLGPIWAPETYIFVEALKEAGYHGDAQRIAEKFCEATLVGGLAENFNAHTAEGNDDLAFSWTSSVFLLLSNFLKMEGQG